MRCNAMAEALAISAHPQRANKMSERAGKSKNVEALKLWIFSASYRLRYDISHSHLKEAPHDESLFPRDIDLDLFNSS